MREKKVVGVACSDIHLSDKTPAARAERDWLSVCACYLNQVSAICRQHDCPLVIAGDLFDRWNAPPETISAAATHLNLGRKVIAIPGNHDLPEHRLDGMRRSAYGVLVNTGVIIDLSDKPHALTHNLWLHGFPCGREVKPPSSTFKGVGINVAVVHAYCWQTFGYEGADARSKANNWGRRLAEMGYASAVFGDNHLPHCGVSEYYDAAKINLANCGTLIRRKADEVHIRPGVVLIYDDGSLERTLLDTSLDTFGRVKDSATGAEAEDFTSFLTELSALTDQGINFLDTLKRMMKHKDLNERVRKVIHGLLEE